MIHVSYIEENSEQGGGLENTQQKAAIEGEGRGMGSGGGGERGEADRGWDGRRSDFGFLSNHSIHFLSHFVIQSQFRSCTKIFDEQLKLS